MYFYTDCGRRPAMMPSDLPHTPYIVNGQQAEPGEYPWQVRLLMDGKFACGATLLNHHWIFSAAHCVSV